VEAVAKMPLSFCMQTNREAEIDWPSQRKEVAKKVIASCYSLPTDGSTDSNKHTICSVFI